MVSPSEIWFILFSLLFKEAFSAPYNEGSISKVCQTAKKLGFCQDGICSTTFFGFKCSCPTGFLHSKDGNQCIDIDECATQKPCSHHEECYNSKGSYSCVCKGGYERNLYGECQVSDFIFLEAEQILSRQSDEGYSSGEEEEEEMENDESVVVAIHGSGEEEEEFSGNDKKYSLSLSATSKSKTKVTLSGNQLQPTDEDFVTEISLVPPLDPQCRRLQCREGSKCVRDDKLRAHCQCPWRKFGKHCEREITIIIPRFYGYSYMRLTKMSDASKAKFRLVLEIYPLSLNGLILYSGESLKGDGDFFSLGLKNGTLQFRFDCGSGLGILESETKIPLNEWTLITVYRFHQSASLNVNNTYSITGKSKGKYPYITFTEYVYLGGLPDYRVLHPSVGFSAGFEGLVRALLVNHLMYALHSQSEQVIDAYDVGS